MRLTLITLALLALTLTACGSDPLGLVAREEVRTQGAIEIAQIDAATTRATAAARIGGAIAITGILALAVVAMSMVAGATHIVAQRDRLTAEQWRNQLPVQQPAPPSHRIHDRQPATGHWMALRRPDSQQRPTVLALPERSASAHDVIVIDG